MVNALLKRYVAAALMLGAGPALGDTRLGIALGGEVAAIREDGVFAAPADDRPLPVRDTRQELYLRHARRGAVMEWALLHRHPEGRTAETQGRLNELYLDFDARDLDFTLGKKVMSFGVGYGFRPLDVIQREERRRLYRPRLEGVPVAVVERMDANSAVSAIYVNRAQMDEDGVRSGTHEAVLRHYRFRDGLETHALLHWHEFLGASPGAGFTWVHGDGVGVHGSLLYRPRLPVPAHTLLNGDGVLALADPWVDEERRDVVKAVLGATWTGAAGYSLLLEAWHDGEAASTTQWQELLRLAAAQRQLLGHVPDAAVYGNLAWNQSAYRHGTAVQNNLLLRLAWAGDSTEPYLEFLLTPEDRGHIATLGLDHRWRRGWRISAGARAFGGPDGSAYGQFPQRHVAFVELSGEMLW